ncbi:MAG: 23S rRNA (adenine(2503)-C(2))-methyltransferase RlmN [Planctomycetes bacterium]|nr:23S rRNA (adenine(2503)-C(2))-methyltransferase RlmN [Planctomycetota bacterium]
MKHVLDPENHDLDKWLSDHGQPAFRGRQIRKWLFEKRARDFHDMTDLPLPLREQLKGDFSIWTTRIADRSQAGDGTEKLLLDFVDGRSVECVLLRDGQRRSICVSTQVGCAMGCDFCASGLGGVERNLTAGEIVEQMLRLQQLLPNDERLSHIVVMGMGEPLANLDAVLPALQDASSKDGLGISVRRITISTVGLPAAIDRLAKRDSRYHLAVSLHAPNDTLRNRLVPINKKTGLTKTLAAADRYFETSGRRLTFEYVLLAGVNDQPEHAHELAALLRGRAALLNVIPYNRVTGLRYQTPTPAAQRRFREILEQAGLAVKIRQRKGDRISAACGQLRRSAHGV